MSAYRNLHKKSAKRVRVKSLSRSRVQVASKYSSNKKSRLPASMVVLDNKKPSHREVQNHLTVLKNVLPPSQRDIVGSIIIQPTSKKS